MSIRRGAYVDVGSGKVYRWVDGVVGSGTARDQVKAYTLGRSRMSWPLFRQPMSSSLCISFWHYRRDVVLHTAGAVCMQPSDK